MGSTIDFTSLTTQEILDLAKPTPEYAEILRTTKLPPFDWSDSAKVIELLRLYVQSRIKDESDPVVAEDTLHAPARDGYMLPLRVYRTKAADGADAARAVPSPLIVLYHGGAFVLGSPATQASLARILAKRFNAVVVTPAYRLAPESVFPTGFNDAWDSLQWIVKHAANVLDVDATANGLIIGGTSSGGNIANALAHLARDNDLKPPITGLWLCASGARLSTKYNGQLPEKYSSRLLSRTQDECVNSLVTPPELSKLTHAALQPDANSELYAPLIWSSNSDGYGHKGLPKTYFQVCGLEASRDEQLILEDMLKGNGTPTRLDLYPGLPHAFWSSYKDLPESKRWEERTVDGFAWLLKS